MIKINYIITAGIMALSYVENSIKAFCFQNDIDVKIDKGSGIFCKPLFVTFYATDDNAKKITEFMEQLGVLENEV